MSHVSTLNRPIVLTRLPVSVVLEVGCLPWMVSRQVPVITGKWFRKNLRINSLKERGRPFHTNLFIDLSNVIMYLSCADRGTWKIEEDVIRYLQRHKDGITTIRWLLSGY